VEHEDGFTAHYTTASVRYRFADGQVVGADLALTLPPSRAWQQAQKWADMQFTSRAERVGMVAHEYVLVPVAALADARAPLHASALLGPDGRVTLFGGTGGVGKTSLEMEFILNGPYTFVADDVAVLDRGGRVYPNLAYPKIYGYNLQAGAGVRRTVLGGRGVLDRLHWALHAARGPAHVRRRLAPDALYGSASREGHPAGHYLLLFRENRETLTVEPLDRAAAVEASVHVLRVELRLFLQHVQYHAYNRRALGLAPLVDADGVADRWRSTLAEALADVECQIVRIPVGMDHEAFKAAMRRELS